MKEMVILEYIFMFNPNQTWSHLFEFEKELAGYFNSKGLQAEFVKTVDGVQSRRMLVISKKEVAMLPTTPAPQGRPKGTKAYIKSVVEQKMKLPFTRKFSTK